MRLKTLSFYFDSKVQYCHLRIMDSHQEKRTVAIFHPDAVSNFLKQRVQSSKNSQHFLLAETSIIYPFKDVLLRLPQTWSTELHNQMAKHLQYKWMTSFIAVRFLHKIHSPHLT